MSATEFLAMGGYGLYVWGSLGMCAAVVAAELMAIRARRRALRGDDLAHALHGMKEPSA